MSLIAKLFFGLLGVTAICFALLFVTESIFLAYASYVLLGVTLLFGFVQFSLKSRDSLAEYGLREGVQKNYESAISDMMFGKQKKAPVQID